MQGAGFRQDTPWRTGSYRVQGSGKTHPGGLGRTGCRVQARHTLEDLGRAGCRVEGTACGVQGLSHCIQGAGFESLHAGCRV